MSPIDAHFAGPQAEITYVAAAGVGVGVALVVDDVVVAVRLVVDNAVVVSAIVVQKFVQMSCCVTPLTFQGKEKKTTTPVTN